MALVAQRQRPMSEATGRTEIGGIHHIHSHTLRDREKEREIDELEAHERNWPSRICSDYHFDCIIFVLMTEYASAVPFDFVCICGNKMCTCVCGVCDRTLISIIFFFHSEHQTESERKQRMERSKRNGAFA